MMRAMSLGSYRVLADRENPIVTGEAVTDPEAVAMAAAEFLWVHEAPIDEVVAASMDADTMEERVTRYAFEVPLARLKEVFQVAKAETAAIEAAFIETEEAPGKREPGTTATSLPGGTVCSGSGSDTATM